MLKFAIIKRIQLNITIKSRKWQRESVTGEGTDKTNGGEQVTYRITQKKMEITGNSDTQRVEKVREQVLHELRDEGRNLKLKR